MSGINKILDRALGYDDEHESTEDSRNMHFALWCVDARPGVVIGVVGRSIYFRRPCNAAEQHLAELVRATLENLRNPPRYNFPQL